MDKQHLNENLERLDLENLVDGLFFVDRHVSKLGSDAEVVTLTFKVAGKQAAQDLANYIEKAYNWVLDADPSTGPDQFQKYSVFVEINRNRRVAKNILLLLEEIENISGPIEWSFKYKKETSPAAADLQSLSVIPNSKDAYLNMIKSNAASTVKDFFSESNMHNISVGDDGTVKLIKKPNEWSPIQEVGFKIISITDEKPSNLFPNQLSRTVSGLIGGNFVVEDHTDKFIIHNGEVTLEVKDLYAEKR